MAMKDKLSASAEDYLEAIFLVCKDKGEARAKDLIEQLDVSGPSVTEALQMLAKKGLVNYLPYETITLTQKGEFVAEDIVYRHNTLKRFFVEVLCVDELVADEGACKMEHVASPEIIDKMIQYRQFLRDKRRALENGKNEDFEIYLANLGDSIEEGIEQEAKNV